MTLICLQKCVYCDRRPCDLPTLFAICSILRKVFVYIYGVGPRTLGRAFWGYVLGMLRRASGPKIKKLAGLPSFQTPNWTCQKRTLKNRHINRNFVHLMLLFFKETTWSSKSLAMSRSYLCSLLFCGAGSSGCHSPVRQQLPGLQALHQKG